jgi:hypothetical protein
MEVNMSTNEYHEQAVKFLRKWGVNVAFTNPVSEPVVMASGQKHRHTRFDVVVTRGSVRCVFPWYNSIHDTENFISPHPCDFLASAQVIVPGTVDEFVSDYGYTVPPHTVSEILRAYQDMCSESKQWLRLLPEEAAQDELEAIR